MIYCGSSPTAGANNNALHTFPALLPGRNALFETRQPASQAGLIQAGLRFADGKSFALT